MLVVLPACKSDLDLACLNLQLAAKLDAACPFPCLLSAPTGLDIAPLEALARPYFHGGLLLHRYSDWSGDRTWPRPQNWAWQAVARHVATLQPSQPWFWWEADATPLRSGWLTALADAYIAGGKPFAGHRVAGAGNGHMNGVAIYPPDIATHSTNAFLARSNPFDRVLSQDIAAKIHPLNSLIGHYMKPPGRPSLHVSSAADAAPITSSALVLFHGCSDGSLARFLLGTASEPVGLIQHLMRWKYGKGRFTVPASARRLLRFITSRPAPRLIHCVERHRQFDPESERRVLAAQDSWLSLYKTGRVLPAHLWRYPRDARALGDKRDLPYLKDVLVLGLDTGSDDDIVMWTNDDTVLHLDVIDAVLDAVAAHETISSYRINYEPASRVDLSLSPTDLLAQARSLPVPGDIDLGRDLFAFTKPWLRSHWSEIPDMLLGEQEFDLVLAFLLRKHAGIHTTKLNMAEVLPACELPKGYVLHERHDRKWISPETQSSPAKLHNRRLATEFYIDNGLESLVTHDRSLRQ